MKKYINRYAIIGIVSCAAILFLSWGLSSRVFEYLINDTKTELGGSQAEFVIGFGFSNYMITGFSVMQLVLPLLSIWFSFSFKRLLDGYYCNAKPRIKHFNRFVFKDIFIISITAAIALYLGFLLFYIFGAFSHPIVAKENYSRSFLNDVFGVGFAWKEPLTYYLIEGIYKYAIFPFVYCLFSCTIKLYFEKDYMSLLIPMGYYVVMSILAGVLTEPLYGTLAGEFVKALRPSNMLMMGGESVDMLFWYPFISLIPPLAASVFFFMRGIRYEKEHT